MGRQQLRPVGHRHGRHAEAVAGARRRKRVQPAGCRSQAYAGVGGARPDSNPVAVADEHEYPYLDTDVVTDADGGSHADIHPHANPNSYRDGNTDPVTDAYSDQHANTDEYAYADTVEHPN